MYLESGQPVRVNSRITRRWNRPPTAAAHRQVRYADTARRLAIFALLVILSGCSNSKEDSELSRAISQRAAGPEGSELRIADLAPNDWSRFCVFPPYSDRERIESALGFAWDTAEKTGIDVQEGSTLFVLTKGQGVESWTMHPRDKGDFADLGEPYCRERDDAVFVTSKGPDGRVIVKHESQ